MTADRKCFIGGKTIEEYYWNGKYVVYVNNVLVEGEFEEICADIESKKKYPDMRRFARV